LHAEVFFGTLRAPDHWTSQLTTLRQLAARVRRLDDLSRGLAKEVVLWMECNDPLRYLERTA
jgi:hypothetical protein